MPQTSRRTALTLLELAAVVAAMAVLAAMLTPALGDVRRRGKDTVCLQNLARIAQASAIYAGQDSDGQAVPMHAAYGYDPIPSAVRRAALSVCWGGKSGRGIVQGNNWFWSTAFGRGPSARPLNAVLYKGDFPNYAWEPYGSYSSWDILERWVADLQLDLAVYRCPSDTGFAGLGDSDLEQYGHSAFDHYGNSYNATELWLGHGPGSNLWSNAPMLHRLSDISAPERTLWYVENCAKWAHYASPLPDDCNGAAQDATIRGWHGQDFRFNVAFLDGHAGMTRIRGYQNPDIGRYPGGDYALWKCVLQRGEDWQIDTLPVAPVETRLIWEKSAGDQTDDGCGDCPARVLPPDDLVVAPPNTRVEG